MRKSASVVTRTINEQTILVPLQFAEDGLWAFTLNELGAFLWQRIDGDVDIRSLTTAVCKEYEVSEAEALGDIEDFLGELQEMKILL